MVEKEKDHPSFVYSYTTGPILYQAAIKAALSKANVYDATKNIKADPDLGRVVYSGSILAIAPGNEEDCRKKIIEAYNALLNSSEKQKMTASYADLLEVAAKARQAFEETNLLGYIPGSCNVCKRLGM